MFIHRLIQALRAFRWAGWLIAGPVYRWVGRSLGRWIGGSVGRWVGLYGHLLDPNLKYFGTHFCDCFDDFRSLWGSGGTPEQHWDPGSTFSENGSQKTLNPSPFLRQFSTHVGVVY